MVFKWRRVRWINYSMSLEQGPLPFRDFSIMGGKCHRKKNMLYGPSVNVFSEVKNLIV